MSTARTLVLLSGLSLSTLGLALVGCEKQPAPKPAAGGAAPAGHDDHYHAPGDGHDHADHADHADGHDHGPTTQLGEQLVGAFTVKASHDGELKPGSDAPVDVWVTSTAAKVSAVRFWFGTEDAKGSMKAKAELEKDNWHTHAEIPNPLPTGSKLWVEIEDDKGEKVLASFAIKA